MRIAVLGVGLIGGSIGLAARRRARARVCGYDPDERVLAKALALGAIDTAARDIAGAVADADVVFVAAPVGALDETVRLALAGAGPDCVVSDVGSTKRVLADAGLTSASSAATRSPARRPRASSMRARICSRAPCGT